MGIFLYLFPDFLMIIRLIIIALGALAWFLIYNIKLTREANLKDFPRPDNTWMLIISVGLLSWIAGGAVSHTIKSNFVEAYNVISDSMENALYTGDRLIATKNMDPEKIKNGDIIVFEFQGDPRQGYQGKGNSYIDRVIATGGQTVQIIDKQVYVDGERFYEPFTVKIGAGSALPHYPDPYQFGPGNRDNMPEITVPEGKLFVMGDNRKNASDSRYWGFVNFEDVISKARFIYFSRDPEGGRIGWERIGRRLDE
jgi:signal peptidase I